LRAAVMEGNAINGADVVTLQAFQSYKLTISGASEDGSVTGDLDVLTPLIIHGNGAGVNAQGLDNVFHVTDGIPVSIDNLGIRGAGTPSLPASAILAGTGALTLANVTFASDVTPLSAAGPVTMTGGSFTIYDLARPVAAYNTGGPSTFTGVQFDRMGLMNFGAVTLVRTSVTNGVIDVRGGTATIVGSTIVGSVGVTAGAATLTDTTVSGGSGIGASGGTITVTNSIIATSGVSNCSGAVTSAGYNLSSDLSCGFTAVGDAQGVDAKLGPFTNNGGMTKTLLPLAGSPAIDAGKPGCVGTDQRGKARPVDGDGNGSVACDKGAVEVSTPVARAFTVNTTADAVDATPGDGLCRTAASTCSTRAAVMEAATNNGADSITLQSGMTYALSLAPVAGTDDLTHGDLDLVGAVTIQGQGATIDGGSTLALMETWGTGSVAVNNVTFSHGFLQPGSGAGVLTNRTASLVLTTVTVTASHGDLVFNTGTLQLTSSTIQHNTSTPWETRAVVNQMPGNATLLRTTIDDVGVGVVSNGTLRIDHSAVTRTGVSQASYLLQPAVSSYGVLTIVESTISDNPSSGVSNRGTAQVTNSTITANVGGGIVNQHPTASVTVTNSIVASPTSGPDCAGNGVTSGGYILSSDATCGFTLATDMQATNPVLGALASNGGPTLTHVPGAGSPAINSGSPACTGTDQRGIARPVGSACDRGAVEQ
jgi:hypothetical protein